MQPLTLPGGEHRAAHRAQAALSPCGREAAVPRERRRKSGVRHRARNEGCPRGGHRPSESLTPLRGGGELRRWHLHQKGRREGGAPGRGLEEQPGSSSGADTPAGKLGRPGRPQPRTPKTAEGRGVKTDARAVKHLGVIPSDSHERRKPATTAVAAERRADTVSSAPTERSVHEVSGRCPTSPSSGSPSLCSSKAAGEQQSRKWGPTSGVHGSCL